MSYKPTIKTITVLSFNDGEGSLIKPTIENANDAQHIKGFMPDNILGQ